MPRADEVCCLQRPASVFSAPETHRGRELHLQGWRAWVVQTWSSVSLSSHCISLQLCLCRHIASRLVRRREDRGDVSGVLSDGAFFVSYEVAAANPGLPIRGFPGVSVSAVHKNAVSNCASEKQFCIMESKQKPRSDKKKKVSLRCAPHRCNAFPSALCLVRLCWKAVKLYHWELPSCVSVAVVAVVNTAINRSALFRLRCCGRHNESSRVRLHFTPGKPNAKAVGKGGNRGNIPIVFISTDRWRHGFFQNTSARSV